MTIKIATAAIRIPRMTVDWVMLIVYFYNIK